MFKIGEFSQIGQVSVRMLRHYDKMGVLHPNHVDKFTGYRYYTLEQLPRLNRILALKDLGLSLEEIARLLKNDLHADQLHGMLMMKQAQIEQTIADEQLRLRRVAARIKRIESEDRPSPYDVVVKHIAPITVVGTRAVVPNLEQMTAYRCHMLSEVHGWLDAFGVSPSAPEMLVYHLTEYRETDLDTEIAIPIPKDAADELGDRLPQDFHIKTYANVHLVASTVLNGSIWDIPEAITAITAWIKSSGYALQSPTFEIHHSGKETEKMDFDNITFEFQTPFVIP